MSKCSDSITLCKVFDGTNGLQGVQGEKGEQGIPGTPGKDGKDGKDGVNGQTSYFHIKYSSVANPTTSSDMTETPSTYIGTYVDFTKEDSTDPTKYTWSRFEGLQGAKGETGIPGTNGTNGQTSYLHIKYSNDGGSTFTANNGESVGDYIGVCTDFNVKDPTTVSSYTWSKIKGEKGATGSPGKDGAPGKDGTSITINSKSVKYQNSTSGDTTPTGTWTDKPNPVKGQYLWSRTIVNYSDGSSTTSYAVSYIGNDGAKGDKGDKGDPGKDGTNGTNGKDGKTGQYTTFQYYASTSDTTQQGGAWSDTMPSISGGKYLWMRTQVVPAGGSISSSAWGTPVLAGTDISKLMTTIETTNSQVVELGDKVTQNTTAINANSTAIATKVSKTEVNNAISNIQVGGRNLIRGTQTQIGGDMVRNSSFPILSNNKYLGLCNICQTDRAWGGQSYNFYEIYKRENFQVGDVVTFSIAIMANFTPTRPVSMTLYRIGSTNGTTNNEEISLGNKTLEANKWTVYSVSWTIEQKHLDIINNNSRPTRAEINYYSESDYTFGEGNYIYLAGMKLERGSKATDWTPAPEDVEQEIADNKTKLTNHETLIQQNANDIKLMVKKTDYATDQQGVTNKLNEQQSKITQNAEAITSKVSKTDYATDKSQIESSIQQTADKIAFTVTKDSDGNIIDIKDSTGIVISGKKEGDSQSKVLIRGDQILLDGSVTADKLDVNTLNSTYLTINGTLSNEVLDTVDTAKEGETVSIGSVDDTKCYLASQLKTKIKNTTSNTMSLFSKLGNLSGVRVLNNTDNSFFVESHFEYYKRFTALPFITNIRNAQGSIYYWPTGQYFSFETLEENPIRTSTDGYNWGYGTNSWASNQKGLFGRFALNRYEEVPTLHCVCYKVGTTDPFRLMSTRDGYNFYNQATLARTSVDDSFFMYSSFDSYPVLVTEKHVYFIAPSGVASFSANSDISVQAGDPLGSQSFHEITLPITPEKVFSGILLKTNSILCCALQYNSTKYFYFYKKSSSSWISFAVPDIIKNKNFSETNYYEIGDYLYIVAYKYVGKLNLTTLSSSSTIETMFSGSIYGVIPISNKYLVVLEYDPSLKTYSKHLYSETRRMGGLPANSSLVSSAFFYKTFPSPMGNICYIDDNTTVILSDANYPSLKVSMTEETYPTDVLAFENATDNYLGTIDSLLPKIPTDKQAVSTDLQLNLPTTIPTDMDTYRKIPTLFAKTDVYLSLASASVESYTRFDTSTNQDVIVPAYSGKPSKVTTSSQSLRINDTEYANSSWFIKNKTALAISFTPNAVAKGVYTGDLNPKEVDGESASARDIGNITPYDTITGREITANEKLIAGNIEPKTASANIGSANQKFDQVYVRTVNADTINTSNENISSTLKVKTDKVEIGADNESGYVNIKNVDATGVFWHIDAWQDQLRFVRQGATVPAYITEAGLFGAVAN